MLACSVRLQENNDLYEMQLVLWSASAHMHHLSSAGSLPNIKSHAQALLLCGIYLLNCRTGNALLGPILSAVWPARSASQNLLLASLSNLGPCGALQKSGSDVSQLLNVQHYQCKLGERQSQNCQYAATGCLHEDHLRSGELCHHCVIHGFSLARNTNVKID